MRNPTPRSLALIAAGTVSAIVLVSAFVLSYPELNFLYVAALFAIAFVSTYFIVVYLLEIFIYRKIKLIYKNMSAYRGAKEHTLKKVDIKEDILGNVNQEVLDWQQNRANEIAELKKLENFRKEFLGNVSHELKTPIFNLQGYIHTLLDGAIEDASVNKNYLQRAAKSAERLALIVDDLESISKLEAGELILEQRTFDIYELVKDVYESSEMKAKEKNITLKFQPGSDKATYVYADKERIRQVIVNLVVNSIKYGKEKGTTSIGFYDMVENILIEITDDGIGIDLNHLPRIFERFYRVDKSRSRDAGGTGLGLAIVKHIIEAHKQNITARSTPGYGTTFAFMLKKAG